MELRFDFERRACKIVLTNHNPVDSAAGAASLPATEDTSSPSASAPTVARVPFVCNHSDTVTTKSTCIGYKIENRSLDIKQKGKKARCIFYYR